MKTNWRSGGIAPSIFNLCTRQGWVVSFMAWLLHPRVRASGIHWTGGWVGPSADLDVVVVKRKIPLLPLLGTEPWLASPQLSLYWASLAPHYKLHWEKN